MHTAAAIDVHFISEESFVQVDRGAPAPAPAAADHLFLAQLPCSYHSSISITYQGWWGPITQFPYIDIDDIIEVLL